MSAATITGEQKQALIRAVVRTPQPGQRLQCIRLRMPLQHYPEVVLVDLDALPPSVAALLRSSEISLKISKTSALLGQLNSVFAKAIDVCKRSNASIATSTSDDGMCPACISLSRKSNGSGAGSSVALAGMVASPRVKTAIVVPFTRGPAA